MEPKAEKADSGAVLAYFWGVEIVYPNSYRIMSFKYQEM